MDCIIGTYWYTWLYYLFRPFFIKSRLLKITFHAILLHLSIRVWTLHWTDHDMRLQRYLRSLQSHIYFKMETETLSDRENLFKVVPFRLRPMNLRTRSDTNQYEYLHLSGHQLSNEGKLWLLREANGKNSLRPDQNITKKGLVARYDPYRGFWQRIGAHSKQKE